MHSAIGSTFLQRELDLLVVRNHIFSGVVYGQRRKYFDDVCTQIIGLKTFWKAREEKSASIKQDLAKSKSYIYT